MLPAAGISAGASARGTAPMWSDGRAAGIGHHTTARAGRPRSSTLRTPTPWPRMIPLATAAQTRMPSRTTVATAATRLPAALSGASGDCMRRPSGGIYVRGCGRRRSVLCVSGVGGSGVPRAPHAKVGEARQRAIGRSRHVPHEKSVGSAHLTWAAFKRPARPARAEARVGAAAMAF
jgi:hypothetical protein